MPQGVVDFATPEAIYFSQRGLVVGALWRQVVAHLHKPQRQAAQVLPEQGRQGLLQLIPHLPQLPCLFRCLSGLLS